MSHDIVTVTYVTNFVTTIISCYIILIVVTVICYIILLFLTKSKIRKKSKNRKIRKTK